MSYADFIFVSMLHFLKRIDEDVSKRYMALDEAFPKVYSACEQWLAKAD